MAEGDQHPDIAISTQSEVVDAARGLWAEADFLLDLLTRKWNAYQVLILIGLFIIAHLLARVASARFRDWLRTREWPKWRLRIALQVDRRLRVIIFAALCWAVYLLMREMMWPSRSWVIGLMARIATVWVIVAFALRVIRNRFLRRLVTWAAWVWMTLYLLNLTGPAQQLLDSMAVSLGDYRISLWDVLRALLIGGALIAGVRLLTRIVDQALGRNEDITPTAQVLLSKLFGIALYATAFVVAMGLLGVDLSGLALFSGAFAVGLGFGLQKVVSNLVSGLIILLDKSVKPGDVISLGDTFGWIDALGARYTSVVTRDGKEYLIPNEDLVTGQVVNWSHTNDFVRLDIQFGASYQDDPHQVSEIAINAAMTVQRVLAQRRPVCWVTGFGEYSVQYVLRFWISDAAGGLTNVRGMVYLALWDAFKANGITLPFPQREVRILPDTADPPPGH